MKKIFLLLPLILVTFTSFCQSTSHPLYSSEIYKGLQQGILLKDYVSILALENESLKAIIKKDSTLITELKSEILKQKEIIDLNLHYAEQDRIQEGMIFRRVQKGDKNRWGLGLLGGYGLSSNFSFTPVVGVGVSYDLFRL